MTPFCHSESQPDDSKFLNQPEKNADLPEKRQVISPKVIGYRCCVIPPGRAAGAQAAGPGHVTVTFIIMMIQLGNFKLAMP